MAGQNKLIFLFPEFIYCLFIHLNQTVNHLLILGGSLDLMANQMVDTSA